MANHAMQPITASLPCIPAQPTAADRSPLQPGFRLVPAKVGRTNETSVIVWVQCPTWCDEDHVAEPVVHVEELLHRGGGASVAVHTGLDFHTTTLTHSLHAYLESDPLATNPLMRGAHIAIEDGGGNDFAYITPDMAEKLADDLIGFASELRHLARTARQANRDGRSA